MEWIREALQGSHADKKAWQERELAKLQAEQARWKKNLDTVYEDRLSGAITPEFWQEKSEELRDRMAKVEEKIAAHETANLNYFDDGIRLL